MAITRWQPFGDLFNVYDRINRLFEQEFFPESRKTALDTSAWTPLTDIYEAKDKFVVKTELPGFVREDIRIDFVNDVLTIKGERKHESEEKMEDFHRIERSYGSFQRSFSLPRNVDTKKIEASLKDGLLMINIPKSEESKAKAIPISVK